MVVNVYKMYRSVHVTVEPCATWKRSYAQKAVVLSTYDHQSTCQSEPMSRNAGPGQLTSIVGTMLAMNLRNCSKNPEKIISILITDTHGFLELTITR